MEERLEPSGVRVVELEGELDADTLAPLQEALSALLAWGACSIVLELSQLSFMDSTGMAVLFLIRNQLRGLGGRLALAAPGPDLERLLVRTGASRILPTFATLPEALEALKPPAPQGS